MPYDTDTDELAKLKELVPKLPKPSGYKVLIAVAKMAKKIGSVEIPDEYRHKEDTASILGYVVAVGPDAYKDPDKFPSGPYCKEDDWVSFRSYGGTRLKVGPVEFRFLNDDQIESVVPYPALVERM